MCCRHHIVKIILRETYANGLRGGDRPDGPRRFVVQRDDLAGIVGQSFTSLRRHETSALSDEKLGASLLLQFLELHADGGLRPAQFIGSTCEAALLDADQNRTKSIDVKACHTRFPELAISIYSFF